MRSSVAGRSRRTVSASTPPSQRQPSFSPSHMSAVSAVRTARALFLALSKQARIEEGLSSSRMRLRQTSASPTRSSGRTPRRPRPRPRPSAIPPVRRRPAASPCAGPYRSAARSPPRAPDSAPSRKGSPPSGSASLRSRMVRDSIGGFRAALPIGTGYSAQHPGVLDAAALAGIDDQRALAERDAGETAGDEADGAPDQAIGPEIDMAPGNARIGEGGRGRKLQRRLAM